MSDNQPETPAQTPDTTMASMGGKAAAANMTKAERAERARKAAEARWTKDLPRATHSGEMVIGNATIPCYVLEDGRRLISHRGLQESLGLPVKGGATKTADVM